MSDEQLLHLGHRMLQDQALARSIGQDYPSVYKRVRRGYGQMTLIARGGVSLALLGPQRHEAGRSLVGTWLAGEWRTACV